MQSTDIEAESASRADGAGLSPLHEILFEQSVNTAGAQGFHIVNSSEVLPDTEYWLYYDITDGLPQFEDYETPAPSG